MMMDEFIQYIGNITIGIFSVLTVWPLIAIFASDDKERAFNAACRSAQTVLLACIVLILSGCAHQDEWTKRDTWGQVAATIAIIGDGVSSVKIRETENISEHGAFANHFIGDQPTTEDLFLYHTTLAISSYLIARALPAKWRPYFQAIEVGAHGYAWYNNCQLELC